MFNTGIGIAALLAALGIGYIIRLKAEGAKGNLRKLGIVIAYIIMVVSLLSAGCQLFFIHYRAFKGKAFYRPMRHMRMEGPAKEMEERRR